MPVLGIDPAPRPGGRRASRASRRSPVLRPRARAAAARRGHGAADVIIANNVIAQCPTSTASSTGMRILLADDGVVTIENPTCATWSTTASSTRSTTSTSATSRAPRSTARCAGTGCTSTTSSTSPRSTAARCGWHVGTRGRVRPSVAEYLEAERAQRPHDVRLLPPTSPPGRAHRDRAARAARRAARPDGEDDRGVRRRGQGHARS